MGNRLLGKRGQSTLETTIVFVLIIFLLAGITQIWFWMNNQIIERQRYYNRTRVTAGKVSQDYKLQWSPEKPPELGEGRVLPGE